MAVYCCAYDIAGGRIFTGSDDYLVKVRQDPAQPVTHCLHAHVRQRQGEYGSWHVAGRRQPQAGWSLPTPIARAFAVARDKRLVRALPQMWSAETGVLLRSCRGHTAEVTDFAVSPDGKLLASGDTVSVIRVWSLEVGLPWESVGLHGCSRQEETPRGE